MAVRDRESTAAEHPASLPVTRMSRVMLFLLALCSISPSFAAEVAATPTQPLRVVTGTIAPFVLKDGDKLTGFSVDLWNEVARRMRVEFAWVDAGSRDKQLEAVQRGDADIAISAIVMTPEREQYVDFSLSYFHSGLQILVRAEDESPILVTLLAIPWVVTAKLFAAAIVLMFLWANVLWFIERRRQPERIRGYLEAV
ncbi:MAG TPA: transporter substrate-binding domain-containing protein [Casimicrobiaceae bacterium]|jgi:ABC-type amino acid transport substrate-binding protein